MSGKYQSTCNNCGKLEKLVPAGVSKRTGRKYDAFYACGSPECRGTRNVPSKQESAVKSQNNANNEASTARYDALLGAVSDISAQLVDLRFLVEELMRRLNK